MVSDRRKRAAWLWFCLCFLVQFGSILLLVEFNSVEFLAQLVSVLFQIRLALVEFLRRCGSPGLPAPVWFVPTMNLGSKPSRLTLEAL